MGWGLWGGALAGAAAIAGVASLAIAERAKPAALEAWDTAEEMRIADAPPLGLAKMRGRVARTGEGGFEVVDDAGTRLRVDPVRATVSGADEGTMVTAVGDVVRTRDDGFELVPPPGLPAIVAAGDDAEVRRRLGGLDYWTLTRQLGYGAIFVTLGGTLVLAGLGKLIGRMRRTAALVATALALAPALAACASDPAPGERPGRAATARGPASAAAPAAADDVVAAFADTLLTYYEEQRRREAAGWRGDAPPEGLAKARAYAGARLIEALSKAGAEVPETAARRGLRGLAPIVERYVHTRTALAFATIAPAEPLPAGRAGTSAEANAFPGSFLVAGSVERETGKTLALAGGIEGRYHLVAYDATVVEPYDAFVARRAGAPLPIAARVHGDVVYLDRAAIRDIGRRFLATAARYRALESRARAGGPLTLAEAKDTLRARSLEGVSSLDDFVARYGLEQERHAAAVLVVRAAAPPAPDGAEARALLALAGSADGDLDPRGPIATAIGLKLAGLRAGDLAIAALGRALGLAGDAPEAELARRLVDATPEALKARAAEASHGHHAR